MSRLANMPIKIPSTVKVTLDKVDGLNKLLNTDKYYTVLRLI